MNRKRIYENFYKIPFLFLFISGFFLSSCKHSKIVTTSFYYWKTVYKQNSTESSWLTHFNTHKLYVRIMDVEMDNDGGFPIPVSPIVFQDKLPDSLQMVPVVFIGNDVLKKLNTAQITSLSNKIVSLVSVKVRQSGKTSFDELQIDCDWTATTRDNYFYLLRQLKLIPGLTNKTLSATLRLHQLKNQKRSGIPPVNRAMLMCYNMGDLRLYGHQNSILELTELKKYLGENIATYPMPIDVGLPLFNWAVAFRNKQYIGISKRLKIADLNNKNQFIFIGNNIYKTAKDLPEFGLNKADEVRWEDISVPELKATASYLSSVIKADPINVIYFHLDAEVTKLYQYSDLEKVNDLLH